MNALREHQGPHKDQLVAALHEHGAALDGSDTGTGKTFVACAVARALNVVPLVICPKSVVPGWQRAAEAMNAGVEAVGYEKARGASRYETQLIGGAEVKVRRTGSKYGQERTLGSGSQWVWKHAYQMVIFDEVQRCGGMTSLSSKMLIAAKRQARYVLCLSATAADRPEKMKALGYALGLFDTTNFKWWMLNHGVVPGHFGGFHFTADVAKQREVMKKLHADLYPSRGARMRKGDIPGFPLTQVTSHLIADASGRAKKLMVAIRDLYLFREQQAADAAERKSVLEQIIRSRQALELLKVSDLAELAVDYALTSKVVIFVHFRDTIDALRKVLAKTHDHIPVIDGQNNKTEREIIKLAFQRNEVPILICNAGAGGVGLDLHDPYTQVERTALISPGWSAPQLHQVLGRVHRDGGGFSQQLLVGFANTLEEQILNKLANNCALIGLLNDGDMNGL